LRATHPKLLHYAFTFLADQIERFYDLCSAIKKARSCLGSIGIEHVAVSRSWSLEIQVVYFFFLVEALAHLLIFCTFLSRIYHVFNETGVFKLNNYAFGRFQYILVLFVSFAATNHRLPHSNFLFKFQHNAGQ